VSGFDPVRGEIAAAAPTDQLAPFNPPSGPGPLPPPKWQPKRPGPAKSLLEFYKYPAEHWIHLRTTNPIESTFATVRLRTKVTKGPGSRAAGIAMAYKLIDAAQARWRAVNAPHPVALVRAGAIFHKGKLLERSSAAISAQAVSSANCSGTGRGDRCRAFLPALVG
jgi:putative transposase